MTARSIVFYRLVRAFHRAFHQMPGEMLLFKSGVAETDQLAIDAVQALREEFNLIMNNYDRIRFPGGDVPRV